jgi:hypothetical protein
VRAGKQRVVGSTCALGEPRGEHRSHGVICGTARSFAPAASNVGADSKRGIDAVKADEC